MFYLRPARSPRVGSSWDLEKVDVGKHLYSPWSLVMENISIHLMRWGEEIRQCCTLLGNGSLVMIAR